MAKQTFETAIERLEEIAALLEAGTQTLDASLKLYEESTHLLEFCLGKLKVADEKIQILARTAEDLHLETAQGD